MIAYLGCNYFHNIGNDMRYAVKEKKNTITITNLFIVIWIFNLIPSGERWVL